MTYDSTLTNYHNAISTKFPDDASAHKKGRRIQATTTKIFGEGNIAKPTGNKGIKQ